MTQINADRKERFIAGDKKDAGEGACGPQKSWSTAALGGEKKNQGRQDLPVPISQMWTVASYVVKQKLAGRKRYPLVLMLEPLFRCNLACAGCGKIQYPAHILKKELTPEQCFRAVDECGAPMVSIPGGEPLMHSQIGRIVEGLVARQKYIYLCTNALLLKEKLDLFKPSKYLTFSVHVDGEREHHDFSVCREGGYDQAIEGMKEALRRGFRVTTNTTLFDGADPNSVRDHFDQMMELGVEGMMLSPGYSYDKAPDQKHFLGRARTRKLFRAILSNRKKSWQFNQSPLFLEFLMGERQYACTPWGMPTYNIFGWQKPCYLLQDGYADTFQELMDSTAWHEYGTESGNPKCANCMVHSGYEASAVNDTFSSLRGLLATAKATLFTRHKDEHALKLLNEHVRPVHSYNPLVQIEESASQLEETSA
jgi:hopanoid biosynthesis associated radical SAM protein HpnH